MQTSQILITFILLRYFWPVSPCLPPFTSQCISSYSTQPLLQNNLLGDPLYTALKWLEVNLLFLAFTFSHQTHIILITQHQWCYSPCTIHPRANGDLSWTVYRNQAWHTLSFFSTLMPFNFSIWLYEIQSSTKLSPTASCKLTRDQLFDKHFFTHVQDVNVKIILHCELDRHHDINSRTKNTAMNWFLYSGPWLPLYRALGAQMPRVLFQNTTCNHPPIKGAEIFSADAKGTTFQFY